jgi:serine/threonine protein kinase
MTQPGPRIVRACGRYTDLERIALGGMAEVFRATQHGADGLERAVILKRIIPAFSSDARFQDAFMDEAHLGMSFNHGNVVAVLDVVETHGSRFLVMELVDGWDLAAILRRAANTGLRFPLGLGLHVTAEVCRALAYVHDRKNATGQSREIVHRDINPQNVLIGQHGEVKLTDFGIARATGRREQTFTGLIKGHPEFMSPEQASGAELDGRSDIYSVGSMLYRLAAGVLPFQGPSDYETLLLVQRGDFLPPDQVEPDLHPAVASIVNAAMQRQPSQRYQSAHDLLQALEQALRTDFGAVGQTELQRWLAVLGERDGELATSRRPAMVDEIAPAVPAPPAVARPRRRSRRRVLITGAFICGTLAAGVALSPKAGTGLGVNQRPAETRSPEAAISDRSDPSPSADAGLGGPIADVTKAEDRSLAQDKGQPVEVTTNHGKQVRKSKRAKGRRPAGVRSAPPRK